MDTATPDPTSRLMPALSVRELGICGCGAMTAVLGAVPTGVPRENGSGYPGLAITISCERLAAATLS